MIRHTNHFTDRNFRGWTPEDTLGVWAIVGHVVFFLIILVFS